MASGTLANLASSGFVRTPSECALSIAQQLLQLPQHFIAYDPTAGEGDLLVPFAAYPGAQLLGVEISADRVAVAKQRLPQAHIVTSAVEQTRLPGASVDLVLANPPYYFVNGVRAEYRVIKEAGESLRPGGIMVAIIPARSGWDKRLITHMGLWYDQIQCWKFPPATGNDDAGDFAHYTQIVVVGVRRRIRRDAVEEAEMTRLGGWRWKIKTQDFVQGFPPPALPNVALAVPYVVPESHGPAPVITLISPDDAMIADAVHQSGVHHLPAWRSATSWREDAPVPLSVMPILGEAHLAAEILTGLLDNQLVMSPEGVMHLFATCVTSQQVTVPVDEEELLRQRSRGVINLQIIERRDLLILTVLNLATGDLTVYQGEAAMTFLSPWLSTLSEQALAQRIPRYALDPADWEIAIACRIGLDKQLPNTDYPGLVAPQLHRTFAMARALDQMGRVAIQGEPGCGKTRMAIALIARQAYLWHHPSVLAGHKLPRWMNRLGRAWRNTPRTAALLATAQRTRPTYPALVVTPRRVIKTWEAETVASWKEMEPPWEDELVQHWPEAEVVHIHSQQDVQRWMERCAVSEAPAVIGIVPHSLSRAFGQEWVPALITQPTMTVQERSGGVPSLPVYSASGCPIGYRQQQLALDCPKAVAAQYEAVNQDDGKLIGYRHRTTGVWLTEDVPRFRCPACGTRISSTGNRLPFADADEPMEEIPVTDRIWFTQHQRTCTYQAPKMKHPCGSPLWTRTRVEAVRAKYPTLSYADWQQAVSSAPSSWDTPAPVTAKTGRIITADRAHGAMAPDSWSPFDYLYQFFRGCVGVTIIDESHNMRNAGTDIGHALHLGQLSAQGYVYASGTHYGGCLDDFFYYWFRFDPEFWRRLGLEWTQCEDAVQRYGVIQTLIKEHEASSNKGTGETSTSMTKVVAPGISTRLIPHLLTNIAFLGIIDVGLFMPPRIEIPCIISLIDPLIATEQTALRSEKIAVDREIEQRRAADPDAAPVEQRRLAELDQRKQDIISRLQWLDDRDLSGAYQQLTTTLTDLIKDGNRAASLAEGTIPRWFVCCPMDKPFVVIQTVRNTWGRVESTKELVRTRQLAEDFVYPLERELQARVSGQIAEGRRVMVYIEQTQIRRLHTRLAWVLAEQNPWCLPGNTDAEDREQAIRDAVHRGHQVVIVPYRSVAEGINLQDCIDTIAFYEMPMNLFYLDQAGRRAWRLGKVLAVLILYFAYSGTQVYRKLWKLGNQSGAASAFAGEPARGALVERVGGDQSLIHQFSRNLARGRTAPDEIAELTDAFARRAEELQTVLKTGRVWIGLTDTLPERLAQAHQRRLIDSTACATRVVDADVIPVSLPTVPERGPHVMSIAAPIEERRHPNVPMTLDILHAWEAGRWPAVDCPPTVTNLLQRTLRAVVEYIGIECLAQRLPSREDLLDCFQQEFQYVQADVLSAVSWSQVAERATALCDLFHEQMVPKFHPIELISEEAVTLPNSSVPFVATPVAMTEPLRQGVRCRTLLDVVYTEDPDCWSERAVEQMDLPTAYLLVDRLRHADVTEMAQRVTFLVCIGDPVNRSSVRLEMRTTTRDAAQRKAFGLRLLDAAMAMNVSLAGSSTEVTSDERAAPAIDLPLVTRAARPTGTGESRSGATEEQSGLHDDVVEVPATLPTTDARPVVPASPTLPTTERFSMGDAECLLNPPETVMTGGSSERENLPVPVPVPTAYMRRMHLQVFPLEDTTLVQLVIEDQSDRSVTRIVRTTDEERLANLVAELQTYLNDHLEMWIAEQPAPIVLPVAPKPVAPKPVAPKPVAPKPVAAKPVAAKPVAAKPVAAKPVAAKPVAPQHPPQSVPTAYRSAVEQPTLL